MQLLFIDKYPLYIEDVHEFTATLKEYAAKVTKNINIS
jgi:hypothetical protein